MSERFVFEEKDEKTITPKLILKIKNSENLQSTPQSAQNKIKLDIIGKVNINDIKYLGNVSKFLIKAQYHESWLPIFSDQRVIDELVKLNASFQYEDRSNILPEKDSDIFRAFTLTSFPPKVVILGQDPYIKANEACGLSFSVPRGTVIPKSLKNIYTELSTDIEGFKQPDHGDLTSWAQQGVLLLNSALTVQKGVSGSHNTKWEKLTDTIISLISEKSKQSIVFIVWGNYAKSKKTYIKTSIHKVFESVHPSPLSASRGFFGCKHFSACNMYLKSHSIEPINWQPY